MNGISPTVQNADKCSGFPKVYNPSAAELEFDPRSAWLRLCHHARVRRVLYRVSPLNFSKPQTLGLTKLGNSVLQKFSNRVPRGAPRFERGQSLIGSSQTALLWVLDILFSFHLMGFVA